MLFYKTETTGRLDWKARSADPTQPRLIRLAWQVGLDGEVADRIINTEGVESDPAALKAHGITTARAAEEGLSIQHVIAELIRDCAAEGPAIAQAGWGIKFHARALRCGVAQGGHEGEFSDRLKAGAVTDITQVAKQALDPDGKRDLPPGWTGLVRLLYDVPVDPQDTAEFVKFAALIYRDHVLGR